MKLTLLALFSYVLMISVLQANPAEDWVLELDKEGIRVYTQLNGGSQYKQIKVTTTINSSVEKVMEILMAFNQYKSWVHHVSESYLINKSDSATYYVFTLEDAVWPMQNRYQVSKVNVEESTNASTVRFRTVQDYIEKRTDAIQIKQCEGYWTLRDRPNHQCSLEYVLIQNPGGHVPPWLANFNSIENPYQSVVNLKQSIEQSIRP
ncbi:MAG: START domain-containing protein [Bacteroidota bacterium]|nr:START domain-containing protein [Bacteroidota bacterium]